MKLKSIISRFDDTIYEKLLGGSAVLKIIKAVEEEAYKADSFEQALSRLYSDQEMLETDVIRMEIIDVLRDSEVKELAQMASVNGHNLYSELKKISIKSSKNKRIFYSYFEVDLLEIRSESIDENFQEVDCQYPLFSHQRRAINQILSVFLDRNRVLLHMPTGSGKTRTATNLICEHMRLNEPTVVVWLANAEELCDQTYDEITSGWKKIGNRSLSFTKFYGDSKEDLASIKDGVVVAGLQKLNALLTKKSTPITTIASRTSLVIIDEAHIAIAETYKGIIELLVESGNHTTNLLGLSATPGRTWNNIDKDLKLSRFFTKNKVTLEVEGYSNPIDYLVAEKYLAKVTYEPLYYNGKVDITDIDVKNIQEHLRLSDGLIKKLSKDNLRNIRIVSKIKELTHNHKRIIVFAMTVEHSIVLATALQLLGINAFSITTQTSPNERKTRIDEYKSDNLDTMILCNYGILTTGFDAPKTSCAVITRPTDSLVLYSQMVGRAIRGERAGGNENAEIVTVIDQALPGFDSVSAAFFNWEDVWI